MSIRFRITALIATALLASCVTVPAANTEAQIRALEQQQVQAAVGRDRATLEKLFAPEFRIVNPSGAVATKEQLLALLAGATAPYRSATYVTESVKVYKDVVVSTGLETVVPNTGAQAGQQVKRRITHVWERDGKTWRLALRHATIVTAP